MVRLKFWHWVLHHKQRMLVTKTLDRSECLGVIIIASLTMVIPLKLSPLNVIPPFFFQPLSCIYTKWDNLYFNWAKMEVVVVSTLQIFEITQL